MVMTPEQSVALSRADKIRLMEGLLRIDNKQGQVVPMRLYPMQRFFQENKSYRNIVLKHRQGGFSSHYLGDMYLDCITIPHFPAAVVSHETRATQRLLDKVQFFYDSMADPKPTIGAESRSEKTFPELHSSIYIGTAGSRAFGRGDTIRKVLLSELAYYEDAEKILNGVEDAVPMSGEITIECTPNGEDNIFFYEWTKAREGKSPFKPFFFPWWWTPDYQLPRDSDIALPEDRGILDYTGEERELIENHHLGESQIRWRRYKIAEKGALFWQEYPEDEVSCFITVGDPVFDPQLLTHFAQGCREGTRHNGGWVFWLPPESGRKYVITADSSAGVPGGSYSAAVVMSERWEVVATFQARLEPHIFASILKELGRWYNNAEIVVERNFTGYAVLSHMGDYGNIYYQKDYISGKVTTNKGWWTNEQTKELMRTAIKDKIAQIKLWDINLVRQLRAIRYIKMKPVAQTFDDLVIALMIACAVKRSTLGISGYRGRVPGWSW